VRLRLAAVITLCICLLLELPALALGLMPAKVRLAGLRCLKLWAVKLLMLLLRSLVGMRFLFDYGEHVLPEQCMVLSNHQSLLDIPLLMHFFGIGHDLRFVAKKELGFSIPFISSILRLEHHAIIRRQAAGASMGDLSRFGRYCRRARVNPVLFPEGTRARDGVLLPFHSAACRRILGTLDLPIVVVALDGAWQMADLGAVYSGGGKANLVCRIKVVAVYAAEAILAERQSHLQLLVQARKHIADCLAAWRAANRESRPT